MLAQSSKTSILCVIGPDVCSIPAGAMLVESSVVNMNGSTIFTYNAAYDGGGETGSAKYSSDSQLLIMECLAL